MTCAGPSNVCDACTLGKNSLSQDLGIEGVVDGIIDLIKKNLIARANIGSDITTGDTMIYVDNTFFMEQYQEVVLIDSGYNDPSSNHYDQYEYARIKEIVDTNTIELYEPVQSDWTVANASFIQKTIGHAPLYEDRVYYGDRDVIPTEDMAITIEPVSLSNEWMYIPGGLSQEYRLDLTIYGKNAETEEGLRILHKYATSLYALMQGNIRLDIDNYETPLLVDLDGSLTNTVIVENTQENRDNFFVVPEGCRKNTFEIQDNNGVEKRIEIENTSITGSQLRILTNGVSRNYKVADYAVFRRHGRWIWDSRVDNIEWGKIQKGSAWIRSARLSWFGKEINSHCFPQKSKGVQVD